MSLTFFQITNTTSNEFHKAMDIYLHCFPINERQPEQTIIERIHQGRSQMYAGRIGNEIVFMALLWPLRGTEFTLLDYLATSDGHRGKSIASEFLKELCKQQGYFLIEVEDPAYADNTVQRQRRIDFYLKNGARLLKDVQFILPPVQGNTPTEMLLMVFPEYKTNTISKELVQALIIQVYKEVYNKDTDGALPDYLPVEIEFTGFN